MGMTRKQAAIASINAAAAKPHSLNSQIAAGLAVWVNKTGFGK